MEFEKAFACIDSLSFFKNFTREEKRFVASLDCNMINYGDSETILRQGEMDVSLFILLSGVVRVVRDTTPEVTLTRLRAGSIFGEVSLIRRCPRTTSVVAEGPVAVLRLDSAMVEQLNPYLLNKIKNQVIDVLVSRLDEINDRLANENISS